VFKISGGALVEENVFYAASNLTVLPLGPYDSNYNYKKDDVIQDGNKHRVSKTNNNQGNPLSNSTHWLYIDPHYDVINVFECTSPVTLRRNLLVLDNQHAMVPAAERSYAVGCNSSIWAVRNKSNNNSTNYVGLTIEENVFLGYNTYSANPAIGISSAGGGVWVNPDVIGNYIDVNSQGRYATSSTASVANWGVNYDATTGAIANP